MKTDTPHVYRIDDGVRTLSDFGIVEALTFIQSIKHVRLVVDVGPLLLAERNRRKSPATCEPEWPRLDLSTWSASDVFFGASAACMVIAMTDDHSARLFMRSINHALLMELRERVGSDLLPLAGVYAE